MRKWAILVLWATFAWPALAAEPAVTRLVTVEQLEQAVTNSHGRRDRRLARQISDMKLTERLSAAGLARLEKDLRGSQAREALVALADESAFLSLPASEIPTRPAPSAAEQAAMLALSAEYAKKTIDLWPNFIATRETTRFEGTATAIAPDLQDDLFSFDSWRAPSAKNWECPGQPKIGYSRLSVIDKSSVAVVYRNGHELHALGGRGGEFACPENAVSTTEEFSHVLAWIPKVLSYGIVSWSHWEQGSSGLLAVFQYSVLVSHRSQIQVEVHGEIALNPADGTILRLTEIRHWTEHEPSAGGNAGYDATAEHHTAVDYGPVNINGITCICPVKRVAIYLAPILWPQGLNSQDDQAYRRFRLSESPLQEYLIDVRFAQYRRYGSP
jgi:hypothetical protein